MSLFQISLSSETLSYRCSYLHDKMVLGRRVAFGHSFWQKFQPLRFDKPLCFIVHFPRIQLIGLRKPGYHPIGDYGYYNHMIFLDDTSQFSTQNSLQFIRALSLFFRRNRIIVVLFGLMLSPMHNHHSSITLLYVFWLDGFYRGFLSCSR